MIALLKRKQLIYIVLLVTQLLGNLPIWESAYRYTFHTLSVVSFERICVCVMWLFSLIIASWFKVTP